MKLMCLIKIKERTINILVISKLTNVHLVKALVFLVVIYGCESWTIKKAECQRTDAFQLLEMTLESPLDCKEIKPVHPKENQA